MVDANDFKPIPYGVADFNDFRVKNYYYVESLRDLISGGKALQVFWNVYLGFGPLYNVYSEKEMGQGFCDLVLAPLLIQYPAIKYSYLIEFKYIKPSENKPENPQLIKKLKEEAETQLDRYSPDEKFRKAVGPTTLKKLVLIFRGNRLAYHSEAQAAAGI